MKKRATALAVSDQLNTLHGAAAWLRAELADLASDVFLLGDVTVGDTLAREQLCARGARVVVYGARCREYVGAATARERDRRLRNADHEMVSDLYKAYRAAGYALRIVAFERMDADPEDLQIVHAVARWYCIPVEQRLFDGAWTLQDHEVEP